VEAGSEFDLIVLAVDDVGLLDESYVGTVSFTSTDSLAELLQNYTFDVADGGRKTLPGTVMRSLGGQRIAVSGATGEARPGSFGLSVYQVGTCITNATTLCLVHERFQVDARWRRSADFSSSTATAVPLTLDAGYFWFFGLDNVELVVKGLDACSIDHHFWIFAGGLTNVEVSLTVVDTQTGVVAAYVNQAGEAFRPIQDTAAFNCP
jgi:hypothetical protein